MAINVRLKDAGGNVLHPETDWSVVLNKPSIKKENRDETWNVSNGTAKISGDGVSLSGLEVSLSGVGVSIRDAATNDKKVPLANYPINYSAIANKPTYFPTSWHELTFDDSYCVFGIYTSYEDSEGGEGIYNPAIRIVNSHQNGDHYNYTYYYFTGTSWKSFTDASSFHSGITF